MKAAIIGILAVRMSFVNKGGNGQGYCYRYTLWFLWVIPLVSWEREIL